ncbi:hypothetical protein MHU86_25524 [Fragilaria crotonensis]|nr:hypothetical protein MHU86_25524 [Fragilaria crotonensis]
MEMPQVSFSNYRLGHNPEFCKMQRCIDTTHHADSNSDAPTLALVKSSELQETDSTQPISILDTDTTEDEDDDHEMTEGERKMKRILANRGSARASYLRRKKMISELQSSVHHQSERNAAMEAENKALRNEVKELREQVRELLLRHSPALEPHNSDMMLGIAIPGAVCTTLPERTPHEHVTSFIGSRDGISACSHI